MIRLPRIQQAFCRFDPGSRDFNTVVRQEIAGLDASLLPLQQGLQYSSYVLNQSFEPVLLAAHESREAFYLKVGIFYQGVVAGCSCTDDPSPADTVAETCEVEIHIDKHSAGAVISLLD